MRRVATAIRFEADVREALEETAEELGVSINWLVTRLVREGLDRIDLTRFTLVRPPAGSST